MLTLMFLYPCVSDIAYNIAVKTGNIPGGSSDSNVFVKLYGDKGDTGKMMLVVSSNNLGNYFETGRVDIFTVETSDIGQVTQRRQKHVLTMTSLRNNLLKGTQSKISPMLIILSMCFGCTT